MAVERAAATVAKFQRKGILLVEDGTMASTDPRPELSLRRGASATDMAPYVSLMS